MKEIKAYIKPHKLSSVTIALQEIKGLSGISISEVKGFGRGRAKTAPDRITEDFLNYVPRIKIEVVCRDELVEEVVSTIERNAHTGIRGDGKIFVSNVEAAVRISTGERGESAI